MILTILTVVGAGLLLLGALVFIHESGHFLMAKALGIRVEVFSLGFGPKLLRFTRGGTEYCVSALPLGGYVKMLGENPDESLRGSREEFLSRSKPERFLVLVMGALLNIVLAVVLVAALYVQGVPEPASINRTVIGWVDPNGAAAEAGLRTRDEILTVAGTAVSTWLEMRTQIALNPDRPVVVGIRREGTPIDVTVQVRADPREKLGFLGVEPYTELLVAQVTPGGPADRVGIRTGDVLANVDGEEMTRAAAYQTFVQKISEGAGRSIPITVRRGEQTLQLEVVPEEKDGKGLIGVGLTEPVTLRKYPPMEAISHSIEYNWRQAGVLFQFLKKLISRDISPRSLSGPIDIFRLAGGTFRAGTTPFLLTMAFISLQLGIMNLLPIPVLDGGQIFILLIEGLIRRDLSMRIKERVMQVGLFILLLIMGGVISLDIYKNLFIE